MTGHRRLVLMATIVLVLSAGVAALAAGDAEPPVTVVSDGRVGLAAFDQLELPTTTVAVRPTTTVAVAQTTTSSPPTTARPVVTTAAPPVSRPPTTTTTAPTLAPASTWQAQANGVTVRMRMEPAAPVAGQTVRFFLDVSSAEVCCTILFEFGDGTERFTFNNEPRSCMAPSPLVPGARSTSATHVYAAPGAYKASVGVLSGDLCTPAPPGVSPVHPVSLTACIVVGPGTPGNSGCSR